MMVVVARAGECGDVFSCHAVHNPDARSQLQLLSAYVGRLIIVGNAIKVLCYSTEGPSRDGQ